MLFYCLQGSVYPCLEIIVCGGSGMSVSTFRQTRVYHVWFTLANHFRMLFWFQTLEVAAFLCLFVWLENRIEFKQSVKEVEISSKYVVITD